MSSSFGSYDLAGFPKAAVWWYRSWWLGNVSALDAGRPPLPPTTTAFFVHIVEAWQPANSNSSGGTRTINVYSNAPFVRLSLNGAPVAGGSGNATVRAMPQFGYVRYSGLVYVAGKLVAEALGDAAGASGSALAVHTRASWGAPAALVLSLDAPSPATGTGGALFLDGGDAALVRATVVDAAGVTCQDASGLRVTFSVTGGPGAVWGTGNGDPANQEPNHAPSRLTYHGLVRAVVKVTQASAVAGAWGSAEEAGAALALLGAVNVDAGRGGSSAVVAGVAPGAEPAILVSASAEGLAGAQLSIPTSVGASSAVLATAAANVYSAYVGE